MSTRTARLRARHGSRMPRSSVLTTALASVAAIAGFSIVLGGAYVTNAQGAIDRYDTRTIAAGTDGEANDEYVPTDFAGGEAINIVVIGTDERNDENGEIGGRVAEGMRGDTTMVVHISADRTRVDVVSIPRDSRVRVSDCELYDGTVVPGWTGKFNIALANGGINGDRGEGAACVMRTITDLTDLEFNGHFIMVDFSGFQNMVDAMGGVPMCITQDMYAPKANLNLEAGAQTLDGETALAFARARTGQGLGGDGTDLSRIERQQELLTNLARKVLGSNVLTDLPSLTQLLRAGAESVSMDSELGKIDNLVGLLYSLRSFNTSELNFYTVPWKYAGDGSGDVLWDEPAATQMWQALIDDVPIESAEENVETTPSATPTPEAEGDADSTTNADAADSSAETATTESVIDTGDATETASNASDPEPSVTPSPVRETEEDILAECTLEY
ncbi:LCP family protein [Demequina sp. B12]|uniref:LCP family protein n=1 Tax=Demequina sp. B12 TaxID=2992757 RepID=UPI00237C3E64|nr:LCP family protein [Demequina sp. B12]MDE0573805.1 LCP family protein [Demequina sp. B12]